MTPPSDFRNQPVFQSRVPGFPAPRIAPSEEQVTALAHQIWTRLFPPESPSVEPESPSVEEGMDLSRDYQIRDWQD